MNGDLTQTLQDTVIEALDKKQPLAIVGGGSKNFLQSATADATLNLSGHRGVLDYQPSELYITARTGTPLAEVEQLLASHQQMLVCEPPHFSQGEHLATLGGTIACGFSGSRRPFAGSLRDHVLGLRLLNGKGELLHFGGQVMKNVAGFDVSRLMVGARGTLGALLEVTVKVMPKPEAEKTLLFACPLEKVPLRMTGFMHQALPLSALAWLDGTIFLRLEGSDRAIRQAHAKIGGDVAIDSASFWESVREQTHPFFQHHRPLWRLSVSPASSCSISEVLIDWCGGLRWWHTDMPAEQVVAMANKQGGYAYLFRDSMPVIASAPPAHLFAVQRRLKQCFDPHDVFNPGLMGGF
jgi:glycolate oxidase FAD binding subunit